jgi:HK97 family phage major capsid protein
MDIELPTITQEQLRDLQALEYVRWTCLRHKHGVHEHDALLEFKSRWPHAVLKSRLELEYKAAISPATTTDSTWGGPLALASTSSEGFGASLKAKTILGRIPDLRRTPLNSILPVMTTGATVGWVGQGAAKPLSAGALSGVPLAFFKAEGTFVFTDELMELAIPGSDKFLRDELIEKLVEFFDVAVFDPAITEIAGTRPASLTNGAPSAAASGTTTAAAATDVKALYANFFTANPDAKAPWFATSPALAVPIAIATGSQTLGATGGSLFGVPAVTSAALAGLVILFDAAQVYVAEEAGISLDASKETSLEFESTPANPTIASTVLKSLWQTNLTAIRAEKMVAWKKARTNALRYISAAAYV